MKKIYLFLLLTASVLSFAQAPLLSEDFDYTVGDALTAHGWAAHSGTSNPILVTSPGLSFDGYVGSNIGLSAGVNNTGYDVNKSFGAQTNPESIYVSFLLNAPSNTSIGGYFFHLFDPTASTAFRARTFITPKTGKMMVGFSFNASAQQDSLSTLLNFGETYLFVLKYTIIDGIENDNVSLFVFKAGDNIATEPATPSIGPLTATHTTATDPTTPLGPDIIPTGIALRQFSADQRMTVDGFRVKTKWQLNMDDASGLRDVQMNQNQFYPNPVTNGMLNFAIPTNLEKQVSIFDLVGKNVFNANTSLNKLDISSLKSGVYAVKVKIGDSTTSSRLVVK